MGKWVDKADVVSAIKSVIDSDSFGAHECMFVAVPVNQINKIAVSTAVDSHETAEKVMSAIYKSIGKDNLKDVYCVYGGTAPKDLNMTKGGKL